MQANITKTTHRFGQLVLAFLLGAGVAAAPVTLYASNYDSGVFEFQHKLAKGGNSIAQYQLAVMYENGRGVDKDINKAREWYKKSAAGKYKPAKHRLIYLDVKTGGFKPSHKPWLNELSADANRGDPEAMYILGEIHEKGIGVKQNLTQAKDYYKSSSARGNVDAETRLYNVEQKIAQQQQQQSRDDKQARQQAAQAEKERKAKQAAAAKEKARADQARQKRLKAEQERRKLEAERRKLEAERRKLEAQRRSLEAQKATEAKAAAEAPAPAEQTAQEDDRFESDLCKGKAARFRTQCK